MNDCWVAVESCSFIFGSEKGRGSMIFVNTDVIDSDLSEFVGF